MAIGFTCISKAKKGTSAAIVFGWYIVVTLIGRWVRGDVACDLASGVYDEHNVICKKERRHRSKLESIGIPSIPLYRQL